MDENNKSTSYIKSHGRRKEAAARVRLFKGNSPTIINGKTIDQYLRGPVDQAKFNKFLNIVKSKDSFYATIKVVGSGKASQLDAILHGLARAYASNDQETKSALRKAGYLTRDPRVKERRKYGLAQKARKGKQSPKR